MIEIVNLSVHPKYFNTFFTELYAEFQSFFAGISEDDLRKEYWKRKERMFIALDNKKFIGCYSIQGCLIGDVYVNSDYRRKGIGRLLIQDAKKRKWYCFKWELYTLPKNLRFYESQGFRIESTTKDNKHHMICYNRTALILLASVIVTLLICVLFF